jgi:hypothetical protein
MTPESVGEAGGGEKGLDAIGQSAPLSFDAGELLVSVGNGTLVNDIGGTAYGVKNNAK